jgi:hypothetical protein
MDEGSWRDYIEGLIVERNALAQDAEYWRNKCKDLEAEISRLERLNNG